MAIYRLFIAFPELEMRVEAFLKRVKNNFLGCCIFFGKLLIEIIHTNF